MTSIILTPDQLDALADAVARRVLDRLAAPADKQGLIDAAEVARRFAVTRAYVYDHATTLGAIRLGSGDRPRLRFNPVTVAAALNAPREKPTPASARVPRRTTRSGAPLLPIGGRTTP